ncbi:MAG TPA: cellulase-like family protein [Candidatus Sulfotelmatobacter sp.]|nr:cellulase-like family protein [Candidatus Sulfotelmatobacter sp.]
MEKTSRRNFLKTASLALPLATALPTTMAAAPQAEASAGSRRNTYFDKGTRLAISMWDFSWLFANCPGGAYEDLERRVGEAAERGYNTLRVDCFPGHFHEDESTFEKNWDPAVNAPQWGERPVTITCNVRKKVAELADACRKHKIWLGLDSWDALSLFGRDNSNFVIQEADEEGEFTRYAEVWVKALKMMREDGVLERAAWIAPMNEVPNFAGGRVAALKKTKNPAEVNAIYRRINGWMAAPIRAEVDSERIPISYSSNGDPNYGARLTDDYDVVDLHFMPGVIYDDKDQKAFPGVPFYITRFPGGNVGVLQGQTLKPGPQNFDFALFSKAWDSACRRHYAAMLERTRNWFQSALTRLITPSGKKLAPIVTECFGPLIWPDNPAVSWDWYKRYNADSLRIVAAMDFKGSSLSNFAEPLFSLWEDADWHFAGTTYFIANAG